MKSLWARIGSCALLLALGVCGCVCAGCGAPQYPATPGNMVHVYKGATSAELTIKNEADTDCSIEGLKYDKSSGTFELQRGSFKSAQSKNQEQLIGWMMQYANQQREYANIRATEWAGVNQLAGTVAGVVGPYLAGRLSLQEMKLQRPSIVEQGLRAITSGGVDPAEFMRQSQVVSPEITAEIQRRIDTLRSPATPPPSEPRLPAVGVPATQAGVLSPSLPATSDAPLSPGVFSNPAPTYPTIDANGSGAI